MKVTVEQLTCWKEAYKDALITVGKKAIKEPTSNWKTSILLAEHSPIRNCLYRIYFEGLKSWVSVHLVRHHVGIEKYVSTQREDRTDSIISRDSLLQGSLVNMSLVLNAQAWINISRKRLCSCASKETREAWTFALDELKKVDPELRAVCVKECIYRGFCPELKSCGYVNTALFTNLLLKYRYGGKYERKEKTIETRVQSKVSEVSKRKSTRKKQSSKTKTTRKTNAKTTKSKRRSSRASEQSTRKNEAK